MTIIPTIMMLIYVDNHCHNHHYTILPLSSQIWCWLVVMIITITIDFCFFFLEKNNHHYARRRHQWERQGLLPPHGNQLHVHLPARWSSKIKQFNRPLCVHWSLIVNLFNRPSRKENHWPRSDDHCNKCLKYLSLKAQAGIPKIGQINWNKNFTDFPI